MFMWTTTKSSYLDFAPGYFPEGSLLGLLRMHFTALMYSSLSSLVKSPLTESAYCSAWAMETTSYYSFLTATVLLVQPADRVSPSESVPSRTLLAFARACFWMSSMESVCLFEKGHALALDKRHSAVNAWTIVFPAMVADCFVRSRPGYGFPNFLCIRPPTRFIHSLNLWSNCAFPCIFRFVYRPVRYRSYILYSIHVSRN